MSNYYNDLRKSANLTPEYWQGVNDLHDYIMDALRPYFGSEECGVVIQSIDRFIAEKTPHILKTLDKFLA